MYGLGTDRFYRPVDLDPRGFAESLVALWYGKCQDDTLPGRHDFDVLELRPWLGHIALYDVEPGPAGPRLRFRLIGTEIVAYDGGDFTGRYLDEVLPDPIRDIVLSLYRAVYETRRPALESVTRPNGQGDRVTWDRAVLPLASDGARIDVMMLFLHARYDMLKQDRRAHFAQ
ncbi:MAG: hypothetical protein OHK0024_05440 [Thalassobaculales bacterium]